MLSEISKIFKTFSIISRLKLRHLILFKTFRSASIHTMRMYNKLYSQYLYSIYVVYNCTSTLLPVHNTLLFVKYSALKIKRISFNLFTLGHQYENI